MTNMMRKTRGRAAIRMVLVVFVALGLACAVAVLWVYQRGQLPANGGFNSRLSLVVWTMNADGRSKIIGKTPSDTPVRIPAGATWGVTPVGGTTLKAAAAEVRAQSIPGLQLQDALDRVTVVEVKGPVEARSAEDQPWRPASAGQTLGMSGEIDIGLNGEAKLRFADNREVIIRRLTIVTIGELTGPQTLDLDWTKATDARLVHLKELKGLQTLDLSYAKVSDAGLVHLKKLDALQTVILRSTMVTDAGLVHLGEIKGLKTLDLSYTNVTDPGLVHLKEIKGLQRLDLRGTNVTDAGMVYLKELNGLKTLDLVKTKVTPAAVVALRRELPGCKIICRWVWVSRRRSDPARHAAPGALWDRPRLYCGVARPVLRVSGSEL